ncbi:fatty acyl-CoA hydrolase precursor, medium chain-like [Dendropsophus ebraccatus]|uniref:fatty acyl-CoA hydrolase precursor, medium chain-like n=1 Tax=Dendropsophus ebraccatus TaxID=150705 RepID=UPI0038319C84
MAFLLLTLLLWPLFLGTLGSEQDSDPQVVTQYGKLQGKTQTVKETTRTVQAFYGVPFAKPPVGSLRFAAPEPPEPWSSVREAKEHAPLCIQNPIVLEQMKGFFKVPPPIPPLSEDCLYLNIFTPADREMDSKLPVMVFIHGGGLRSGGAAMFEGTALSAFENVVVVSMQYRLGLLGFFSNGDDKIPGNYGFLDQVAALKWVNENIVNFGGDPNLVTIFGESAGGISVSALLMSPMSRGLFHRAIAESGVALIPHLLAEKDQDLSSTQKIVSNVSACNPASLLDCLRDKTEHEISVISGSLNHIPFPGRIDGKFIPKPAVELLTEKAVAPVPFIIGVNNHEFGYMIPRGINITNLEEGIPRDQVELILRKIHLMDLRPEIHTLIMDEYFGNTTDPMKIRDSLLDLCGDVMFVIPALRTAHYHRDSGFPVYFYEFQHRPSLFKDIKPDYVKADHGDEIFFVVGGPFLDEGIMFAGPDTEEEKTLSKAVMKYWANFAQNGDPNGPGLVQWPQYDQNEGYLQINLNPSTAYKLKAEKYEFWTKTFLQKTRTMSQHP